LNTKDDKNIKLTNSIQNLTKAVWVIAIILLVDVLLSIFPLVLPDTYLNLFAKSIIGYNSSENISIKESPNVMNEVSFHELTLDEKILESNTIIFVEYIPSDDGRLIATVKEHLKLSNNKYIAYKIGDEYLPSSYYPKEGYSHGDGAILLFRGSSKIAEATFSVYDGRIPSYGDKTIKQLKKELIK
jgi:hypothetical protein